MRKIIQHTWAILEKNERRQFIRLVLLDIFISVIDILSLALLLWIIQFYIQPGSNRRLTFLPSWLADKGSAWFIALFFIFFGIKNIAAYLVARSHFRFIGSVAVRISHANLMKYQHASFEEFVNIDSAIQLRRIGYQPFEFSQHILTGLQQVITQSCLITITIIAILLFNAKLFLLLLIILLPPVVVVFYFIKKRLAFVRKNIRSSNEESHQYLFDALKGYVESNIYHRNDFFLQRFIKARKKFSAALFESIAIQNMPSRIIEVFAILGLFILILIATWKGAPDTGVLLTIGAFMAAAYKIIPGIVKIINVSGQMRAYEFSISDLVYEKRMAEHEKNISDNDLQSIQLKGISFQYADAPILHNVNFAIHRGELIGITGVSGKGKTTLLNILLGFLAPSQGEVLINDAPTKPEEIHSWWKSIAYVRQQGFFIHDTILHNITLQEKNYSEKRLQFAVEASGLKDFVEQSPGGLDKMIMENGKNISGGQQQRIALARALYKNADLILLDEPFNELDESSETAILKTLQQLASQGKMIVLITHNTKCLSYCTKTFSLDEQA